MGVFLVFPGSSLLLQGCSGGVSARRLVALKLKMDEDVCDDEGGYECRNRAGPSGDKDEFGFRRVRGLRDGPGPMLPGTPTGLPLLRYVKFAIPEPRYNGQKSTKF